MKKFKKNKSEIIVIFLIVSTLMLTMTYQNTQGQFFEQLKSEKGPLIDNLISLEAHGNGYMDQTIILFIPGATEGFDSEYDAYKLFGIPQAPQFYSIIPCCNLAVNALPDIGINRIVQMGFQVGHDTTYTISATNLFSFDPSVTIHLEDTKDNIFIDLRTDSVYTFDATTLDDEERFKIHFNYTLFVDLKVFLEGPYNGTNMNTDLNSGGYIPFSQPYNTTPWNYAGTENVGSIPNTDIIDWVLIELRDAADAASAYSGTMIEQQAAFLLNDGTIVGLNGSSNLEFKAPYLQNLYIVIIYRNHLDIMSAIAVTESAGVYSYDFTTGSGQAYGGFLAHKDIGGGVYGMMGGDANADGFINTDDGTNVWQFEAGDSGYLPSDVTLDGQANNQDKDDVWVLNEGSNSQLP